MTDSPQESSRTAPDPTEPAAKGGTFLSAYSAAGGTSTVSSAGAQEHHPQSIAPPLSLLPTVLRGRDALKAELISALPPKEKKIWILHGIAGGGKSTLALWLARQARDQRRPVYWIRNNDVMQSMLGVAAARGVDPNRINRAQANYEHGQDLVWEALESAGEPWVLIFDNIDNIGQRGLLGGSRDKLDGTGWIRPSGVGLVVVTSREQGGGHTWGPDANLRRINCLDKTDGAEMLCDLAPEAGSPEDAARLAHQLGGLPLALRLAGSYLASEPVRYSTFTTYRDAVRHDLELLDAGELIPANPRDEDSARRSIRLTWELSLRLLEERGLGAARPLLQLLACYGAPHPIRLDLLDAAEMRQTAIDWRSPLTGAYLHQVLRGLVSSALVDKADVPEDPVIRCVALHPLLAEVVAAYRDADPKNSAVTWTAAVRLLHGRSPASSGPAEWATLPALHTAVLTNLPEQVTEPLEMAVEGGCRCSTHLQATGLLHAAHDMSELAHRRAVVLGADNPARLEARLTAAVVNGAQGSTAAMRDELLMLHDDAIESLLPDAPFLTIVRQQLALALWSTGYHEDAESLYEELFGEHQQGHGLDKQLDTKLGYAQMMSARGEFAIAEREISEVLAAKRAALGADDHPDLLGIRALLADIWVGLGRLLEARDELLAVLRIQERVHGPDSPLTLAARVTLMSVLSMLNDQGGAQLQLSQLLRIQRDALNPEHPLALLGLAALINTRATSPGTDTDPETDARRLTEVAAALASHYGDDNHPIVLSTRLSAAIQRYRFDPDGATEAIAGLLERQAELFGPEHVTTLSTRLVFTQLLVESDADNPAAEQELRDLLAAQLRSIGEDHPQTALVRSALANITFRNGDLVSSEGFLREALDTLERLHGRDHADTRETRSTLVQVLSERGQYDDAERQLRILIDSLDRTEPESEDTLAAHLMLALVRWEDDRVDEAEADVRKLLGTLRRLRQDEHDGDVLTVQWILADIRRQQPDGLPEAEQLLRAVLDGLPDDDPHGPQVRLEFGELLHERGALADAEHQLQLVMSKPHNGDNDELIRRARQALAAVTGELAAPPSTTAPPDPVPAGDPEPALEPPPEPDGSNGWLDFLNGGPVEAPHAVPASRPADHPSVLEPVPTMRVPPPAEPTRPLASPYRAAMALWEQGRWDDAERALAAIRPRSDAVLLDLVRLHLARGRLADAERLITGRPNEFGIELIMLRRERCATDNDDAALCADLAGELTRPGRTDVERVRARHQYGLVLADRGFPAAAYAELCTALAGYGRLDAVPAIRLRCLVDSALTRPDRVGDEPVARLDRVRRRIADELGAEHDLALRLRRGRAEMRLVRGAGPADVDELNDLLATRIRLSASPDLEKAMLRHDLALAHQQRGDAATAEGLLRQAGTELTELLGRKHPRVLVLNAALASLRGALPELRAVLRDQVRRRGAHHPEVAATRHQLALAGASRAEQLRQAIGIRTRRLGSDHPLTLASRAALTGPG